MRESWHAVGIVAAALIGGLFLMPVAQAGTDPAPVGASRHVVALDTAARRAAGQAVPDVAAAQGSTKGQAKLQPAVITGILEVRPFRVVGVTWNNVAPRAEVDAWVRTRTSGTWSRWHQLPHNDDHGPEPGSDEAAHARAGTDPLFVRSSDAVEVRVDTASGAPLAGMQLDLIDPGRSSADATAADVGGASVAGVTAASAAVGRPTIYTRAQWGADESIREPGPPDYAEVRGAFVHHTVNANDYTAAEVPAIIRGIYSYHVNSRGWRDIGYSFLVDKFGRVWEGRYGGIERAVVGAHTAGYNDDAFAMSAIGTYTTTAPTSAMLQAYQRLFAWKFQVHGVNPVVSANYDGSLWPVVAGHRDAASTECPGQRLYDQLGTIRSGVIALMAQTTTLGTLQRLASGPAAPHLLARRLSDGTLWAYRGTGGSPVLAGGGWNVFDTVVSPGDVDGRGYADVVARTAVKGGVLWLYSGRAGGMLTAGRAIGAGWHVFDEVSGAGDWDGDGHGDLTGRVGTNGDLYLYRSRSNGTLMAGQRIGSGWKVHDIIAGVSDFDGDGHADLIAREAASGRLWLYSGSGTGGFRAARAIGAGWSTFNELTGAGDFDNDGNLDILARRGSDGTLWLYSGNGDGGFRSVRNVGSGWAFASAVAGLP